MKLHRLLTAGIALMAGLAADVCLAQAPAAQQESVAIGSGPQDPGGAAPAATMASPASMAKTREQVLRELEESEQNGEAARLRDLYRGG